MPGRQVGETPNVGAQIAGAVVLIVIIALFVWPYLSPAGREVRRIEAEQASGPTLAQFEQVRVGMTHDQVTRIMGSPGTLEGESGIADIHTVSYHWWGRGDVGANCSVMLQNGRVVSKSQCGLR